MTTSDYKSEIYFIKFIKMRLYFKLFVTDDDWL